MHKKFIDSHCHLDRIDLTNFENDFNQLIHAIHQEKISHMLSVSIHPDTWQKMADLTEKFPEIFLSFGIHPCDVKDKDIDLTLEDFAPFMTQKRVIAIGETGLDYHYNEEKKALQQAVFIKQIEAAIYYQKPLIIHTRSAKEDTMTLLETHNARDASGVMHCFTEDWETAKRALDIGFYISFSGIITFKNAECIRDVLRKTPKDRILIETDSPYLAPIPFRGKQNYPGYLPYTAAKIAEVLNINTESVAELTAENFQRLFKVQI